MSSVKTINRAVLLIWLSYVCQAFIIVYFSKFQKAQKYENQISVAGFRELFMCLFFVNSCVTKNIIQLNFYLIIKILILPLLVPRFITVITQTTIYIILGLLLLLFFDISLYFFYYKTLSIMYKKYYFTRFGASEDLKGKLKFN
ncbi:hypothetical protein TUBRATIS_13610 [Tubulinosema ratisbonensis]|uniref:Uncharacterized protein n=1 Tax=Tubulinosema ratisbonensis TaxID=291195 RepID=A0A437AME3_9MICR|nr:hypothetical protein TUBRATIS_13610 [Tubulinosema ratisbonensis]